MTFEEFTEMIKEEIAKNYPNYELHEKRVQKLQNHSYNGLVVKEVDSNIGMTLNLDSYYKQMENGRDTDEILNEITEMVVSSSSNIPMVDTENLKDYSKLKDNLIMQMVPVKGNEEMLSKVPHKRIEDLAVVYRIMLSMNDQGEASILLTNDNCQAFGISKEQAEKDAQTASEKNHPLTIKNMETVLFGIPDDECDSHGLHVVSNETGRYGASVIAYPGALEKIAQKMGGSFYLIPSSIHEVLVMQEDVVENASAIDKMVSDVNKAEVAVEERLSDHCYHYDAEFHMFEAGSAYNNRIASANA